MVLPSATYLPEYKCIPYSATPVLCDAWIDLLSAFIAAIDQRSPQDVQYHRTNRTVSLLYTCTRKKYFRPAVGEDHELGYLGYQLTGVSP